LDTLATGQPECRTTHTKNLRHLGPSGRGFSTPHALLAFPPLQCPDLIFHLPVDLSSSAAYEAVRSPELSDLLSVPLGSSLDIRRKRPYKHRRFRRCGNGPEHVFFHHSSPCEYQGKGSWASASRRSVRTSLASDAEVLWRGPEATGVADAMI